MDTKSLSIPVFAVDSAFFNPRQKEQNHEEGI